MSKSKQLTQKKITPRVMKLIEQHELIMQQGGQYLIPNLNLKLADTAILKEVCDAFFEEGSRGIGIDLEDADLEEITPQVQDFLLRALGRSGDSAKSGSS